MKTLINLVLLLVLTSALNLATANEGGHLEKAHIDPTNMASLQHGAKLYINYCLGCHSLKYQRYERMAEDLKIPKKTVMDNMMFTADKIGETMSINMPKDQAANWFGTTPPDLSLMARAKGVDYLYWYLKGFYRDSSRPWGVNNLAFKDVGMPHALEPLQGLYAQGEDGHMVQLTKGEMTPEQYDEAVLDIVNFMFYVSEPIRSVRMALGLKVMMFLLLFFIVTYFLKQNFWKDIH